MLHGIDAVRRSAFARRQIRENGVSVDDFPPPGKLDRPAAAGDAISLPPVAGSVALWWFALDRPADEAAALARTLSPEETARAQRFGTESLRQRWIVGRATLRMLLAQALGVAPIDVALARGRRGRPQLAVPSLDFNVSHTCGMALVGIAATPRKGMRIGVDVEHAERRVNADGLARKFLSEREQAALAPLMADQRRRGFLRLWTCKEAMSKATGDALSAPFRRLDVAHEGGLALAAGPPPYTPADWTLHAVDIPGGFLGTVAVWRSNPTDDATRA
jgi:4'-phosphopantetheinyl transferase